MFLFQQGDLLPIKLSKQHEQGVNQSVIHWTKMVRTTSTISSFVEFVDAFKHLVAQLLNSQTKPKIGDEIKRILHLSEQTKTGD